MPNIRSVFGDDIVERVKYGAAVLVAGLALLLPHFFRTFEARAFSIVCCFVLVLYCMRIAIYELETMTASAQGGKRLIGAFAMGIIAVVGATVAFVMAVVEWRLYLVLLLGVFATDSFALLGGRVAKFIGKWRSDYQPHPMTRVSGNKTIEGLVTGVVLGWGIIYLTLYVCAWFAGLVPTTPMLITVAFVPIVAVVGDYFESVVKRSYDFKDSGDILGPHGGMLDRLDSLTAVYASVGLVLMFV